MEEEPSPPSSVLLVSMAGLSVMLASWGRRRATCMAVSPSSSSMLTSAPSATSSCTRSVWPCVTASCSGVWLRLFLMLTSQRPCGGGVQDVSRQDGAHHTDTPALLQPPAHLFDEDLSHVPMVVQSSQVQRWETVLFLDVHQLSRSGQNLLCGPARGKSTRPSVRGWTTCLMAQLG